MEQMNKLILLLVLCFGLSGCSLIKTVTAPFKSTVSTVPQSTVKGKKIIKCLGDLKIEDNGVITCSKGFYLYDENSNVKERNITLKEKIVQFMNNLMGWSFWIVLGLVFLCPSLLGLIVGRLFEGVYGIGAKAFKQVASAVQKVKDTTPTLVDALEKSTDSDVRKWIEDFKKKNCIK
jgi:hypothetical protein